MREFVKASEVKPDDILTADTGFTCIEPGAKLKVRASSKGLCVPCNRGWHYLVGQLGGPHGEPNSEAHYVGFWKD